MHIYTTEGGVELPSVTTILHSILIDPDPLIRWANGLGFGRKKYDDVMEQTANKGTIIHNVLQQLMEGKVPETKFNLSFKDITSVEFAINYAKTFFKEHNMTPATTKGVEMTLMSEELGYAGTLDWLGDMDNLLTLVDYKTSKKVRMNHILQVSAYDQLLQTKKNIKVDRAAVLLIRDTGVTPRFVSREELDRWYSLFQEIKRMHDILQQKWEV